MEQFNRTVLDEFFRESLRNKYYRFVETLQKDLDKWLRHYDHGRPCQGYRNMGKQPIDTITQFLKPVRKQAQLCSPEVLNFSTDSGYSSSFMAIIRHARTGCQQQRCS